MSATVPSPAQSRAVIVGLERYAGTGLDGADLPGVTASALALARALRGRVGVPAGRIDLWLSPITDPAPAELPAGVGWTRFSRDGFDSFLTETLAEDAAGGLLLVYWLGHGVLVGADQREHLLLSNASARHARTVEVSALSALLAGADHAQFGHQVLVLDACRTPLADWGLGAPEPMPLSAAAPDALRPVRQCLCFSCDRGQATPIAQGGTTLARALLDGLNAAPAGAWPDFEAWLGQAAAAVAHDSQDQQRPVWWRASGWQGQAIGPPLEPPLSALVAQAGVALDELRQLALRSLQDSQPRRALGDLADLLDFLHDQQADAQGVAPLHEFVARVLQRAGAAPGAQALSGWYGRQVSAMVRQAIDTRLAAPPPWRTLLLWVDDRSVDQQPVGVKAALCDSAGQPLAAGWDWHEGIATPPATLEQAIGTWIDRALACLGRGERLAVELFVPHARLGEGWDRCPLPDQAGTLGEDLPALLRSADRVKKPLKYRVWQDEAAARLQRAAGAPRLIEWADPQRGDADLQRPFFADGASTVWLGVQEAGPPLAGLKRAIDLCVARGLPALVWVPEPATAGGPAPAAQQSLEGLLRAQAEDITRRLTHWRLAQAEPLRRAALLLDDPRRPPPWAGRNGTTG